MGVKQLPVVQRSQLWQGVPPLGWHPSVFPLQPLCQPSSISLVASFSCVCLVPSCAEAPPSAIRQWSSPQITVSMCLQETFPITGGWVGRGEGGVSSVPNTQAVLPPTAIAFPARLLWLQGKLPEPTEHLLAQTTRLQGPAVALCPSPCAHTHFPLHTDAAQLTRLQESANLQRGGLEGRGRHCSLLWGKQPLWAEHTSQEGAALHAKVPPQATAPHHLAGGVILEQPPSAASLPPHTIYRAIFNHCQCLLSLSLGQLSTRLNPISPFLGLKVSFQDGENHFLLLLHQRAARRFRAWSFASLLFPHTNVTGIEAKGRVFIWEPWKGKKY